MAPPAGSRTAAGRSCPVESCDGLGRKSWLFAGSDRGGVRAAAMYTLIGTAKLNNVNPQAWLADVLDRIAGTPHSQRTRDQCLSKRRSR